VGVGRRVGVDVGVSVGVAVGDGVGVFVGVGVEVGNGVGDGGMPSVTTSSWVGSKPWQVKSATRTHARTPS
jgi:hypothetical protein